jgi:hypothetical protein
MNLAEARACRNAIRAIDVNATVPTGYAPDKYFVQVWITRFGNVSEPTRLRTKAECQSFYDVVVAGRRQRELAEFRAAHPPRTVLDMMIDKACGL